MTPRYLSLRHWPRALLRVLMPSACALCGGGCDDVVCVGCREAYALRRTTRCGRCANPLHAFALHATHEPSLPRRRESKFEQSVTHAKLGGECRGALSRLRGDDVGGNVGICGTCLRNPPAFDATVAAVDYAIPLDQLVLQLKFGARLALAPWFARQIRDAALATPGLTLPDLLCPVPLGDGRLVERGFNQALEIARPLAAALGVACHPALALRTLDTPAQSGVAPSVRANNVRGAFTVADPDLVEGRHVGLVDDVMTSGHTLGELAATFKRFGAARVTNFVFARTPPHT
jgi:ComF family protein